jgi:hypothetical protein
MNAADGSRLRECSRHPFASVALANTRALRACMCFTWARLRVGGAGYTAAQRHSDPACRQQHPMDLSR